MSPLSQHLTLHNTPTWLPNDEIDFVIQIAIFDELFEWYRLTPNGNDSQIETLTVDQ